MRIIYDEYGQTGNRFFSYLDSIGWALFNKKKLVILFPEKILQHFDNLRNCEYISLPLWGKSPLAWRFARKVFYYNKLIQLFYRTEFSKKLGFYAGWDLRESHLYYPKVKSEIENLFIPNADVKKPIDQVFKKLKEEGRKIIGIQIRRGDYKNYKGGMYYYDIEVYRRYIENMQKLVPNAVFYVSSNEPVPAEIERNYPMADRPLNSAVGDLYALSQCDYIMGPPSTFACWASYIGRKPWYVMFTKDGKVQLSDFRIMRIDKK